MEIAKGRTPLSEIIFDVDFEEMTYNLGKEGLPTKAKLLYDTKSSREGTNFEFKYTKWY